MRILLVSDLHYALPQLDWVVRVGPDFDLVVLAGDSLSIRSAVPLEAQCVTVLQYLSLMQSTTRLAVSSGNHDLTGPDADGEQTALWLSEAHASGIPTDGDSLEVDDAAGDPLPVLGRAGGTGPRRRAAGRGHGA